MVRSVQREFQFFELPCSVSICSGGSVSNFSNIVRWMCTGLRVFCFLAHFDQLLHSPWLAVPRDQGLADQLRLNQIVTEVNLSGQNIYDEQAKAPAGQTAAFRGGRGWSWERETEFSWGAPWLTMPTCGDAS